MRLALALLFLLGCSSAPASTPGAAPVSDGSGGTTGDQGGAGGSPMTGGQAGDQGGAGGEASTTSSSASSSSGAGGEPSCEPTSDGNACTVDTCMDGVTTHTEIVTPATCSVRCIANQLVGPHTMCSGTATESEPGAVFLGILWTNPKTDLANDDEHHRCGSPALTSTPGCGCTLYYTDGICQPGWPCDIVREMPNGDVQYIGGTCG